jgi:hypothetical protein
LLVVTATQAEVIDEQYERVPGPDPLLKDLFTLDEPGRFRYVQGQRFTTISNLLPIMEFDPGKEQANQDYVPYIEREINLIKGIAPVSNAIQKTPDLPVPPLPKADFTDKFEIKGRIVNSYTDANNGTATATGAIITDSTNRLLLLYLTVDHDEYELANGDRLKNSDAKREGFGFGYGRRVGDHVFNFAYLKNTGDEAGNPANTFDVSSVDAESWMYGYEYNTEEMQINGIVRLSNIDRRFDSWRSRDWYPNESIAANQYFPGTYDSPYYGSIGGPIPVPCGAPPCTVPNTGLFAVVPGAPLWTNPDLQQHLGEFNSLVDVKQGVDIWDWRFEITMPFRGGTWVSGFDGYLRDIQLKPRKDFDNPAFATGELANAVANATAAQDWEFFGVNNDAEDNVYSLFSEIGIPLGDNTDLYVGARLSHFEQEQVLQVNQQGANGRFLYDVLNLRHILENLHSVEYIGSGPSLSADNNNLDWDDTYLNLQATVTHRLNRQVTVSASLASYHENPAAFERIFPAPFDPASNTTDGRIYIGNVDLDDEHHIRAEFAASYNNERDVYAAARFYFDRIDGYIQGVPVIETSNSPVDLEAFYELGCSYVHYTPEGWNSPPFTGLLAGALTPPPYDSLTPLFDPFTNSLYATRCGGDLNPLRYDNIDAYLYGIEAQWGYRISQHWYFDGIAAWQQGKRRDTGYIDPDHDGNAIAVKDDDLYRILPPYTHMNLTYLNGPWTATLQGRFYMEQDRVSKTNGEQESSGYGVFNAVVSFKPHPAINLDFGVNNIFDKHYTDHLTAVVRTYNQSADPRYADAGDRIGGLARNAFVRLSFGIKWPLPGK